MDTEYLFEYLSMDAAPVVYTKQIKEKAEQENCSLEYELYDRRIREEHDKMAYRNFNLSRFLAIKTYENMQR